MLVGLVSDCRENNEFVHHNVSLLDFFSTNEVFFSLELLKIDKCAKCRHCILNYT